VITGSPFCYLLEEKLPVMLVNAKAARNIPCRKTDVSDAAWLAQLGAHGLLRASFVPPEPIRELRDLTRARSIAIRDRTRENPAPGKVPGRLRDQALLGGFGPDRCLVPGDARSPHQRRTQPEVLAGLAKGTLRSKIPELVDALTGRCKGHHAFMARLHLDQIKSAHTLPGNKYLKAALGTAALSASRSKDTYLAAKYRRITARRGPMKAIVALEHSILTAAWHLLAKGECYEDPGADHFTRLDPIKAKNNAIKKLNSLGFNVTITPATAA
jgi:transposase